MFADGSFEKLAKDIKYINKNMIEVTCNSCPNQKKCLEKGYIETCKDYGYVKTTTHHISNTCYFHKDIKELMQVSNRDRVRDLVLKEQSKKRVKGFVPQAIVKELDIDIEEVKQYCYELMKEDILEFQYFYLCECGYSDVYEALEDIPHTCEWCNEEVDMSRVYVKYKLVRDKEI